MIILKSIDAIERDDNSVVTVGTFDGLHLGHKAIFKILRERASAVGGRSVVVTFDPHPRLVLNTHYAPIKLLNTKEEKIKLLDAEGIDHLVVLKFDKSFAQQRSEDFFRNYIISKIGIKEIVLGYDHHFGKKREGDQHTVDRLAEQYSFAVNRVDAVTVMENTVSSSRIRKLIGEGAVSSANQLLGYSYMISGKVIEGKQRGRSIGFPTANVEPIDEHKLLPSSGVYAVTIAIENITYNGIMNIGHRPTFENDTEMFYEVHIFDFHKDIYNSTVTISFVEKIRDEKKFSSVNLLIEQINKDILTAQTILH